MRDKKNLLNLNYNQLEEFSLSLGLKKFNAKQIYSWINEKCISDIEHMTNISKKMREKLKEIAFIPSINLVDKQVSKIDNTEKYLFELKDGKMIETVLMRHHNRNTICVSSQVGCAVRCTFCATGINGFKRDLTYGEILSQVYFIKRRLDKDGESIRNIVFMGMGEPLLNLENVMETLKRLIDPMGLNLSKRRITISTSGIVPKMEKLIEEDLTVELALSLHATTDEVRRKIIPINDTYPIWQLIEVLRKYQKHSKRKITFEYILIDDLNDSLKDGERLSNLVREFEYVVNIIPYNPVEGFYHKRPSRNKIFKFYNYLKNDLGVNVTLRGEKGTDIDGACGQLRQKRKNIKLKYESGKLKEEVEVKKEK